MADEGSAGPERHGRRALHGGTPYARPDRRRRIAEIQPADDEAPDPRSEQSPHAGGWGWRTMAATPFKVAGMLSRTVGLTRRASGVEKPAEETETAQADGEPPAAPHSGSSADGVLCVNNQAPSQTDAEAGGHNSDAEQASVARRGPQAGSLPNGLAGLESDEKERMAGDAADAQSRGAATPSLSFGGRLPEDALAAEGTPRLFTAGIARAGGAVGPRAAGANSDTPFDDIPSLLRSAPGKRGDLAGSGSRAPSVLAIAAPVFGSGSTPGAVLPTTFGTRRLRFADQATPQLLRGGLGGRSVAGRGGTPYPAGGGASGGLFSTPSAAGRPQTGRLGETSLEQPLTAPFSRGEFSVGPAAATLAGGTPFTAGARSRLSRGYSRRSNTPIHMLPMGGHMDSVSPPSAPPDAATAADAAGPSSTSSPAWSPMQSGNRDRAASGAQPRIGLKRGRSDEEGDGSGGGASLLASGLGDPAAAVGNSAKRRALASRLSQGERRTWRAGATPHAGARLLPALPAPERAPQQAATDAAGGSAVTPGAHAAKLNSSAARRIVMSLQSVDLTMPSTNEYPTYDIPSTLPAPPGDSLGVSPPPLSWSARAGEPSAKQASTSAPLAITDGRSAPLSPEQPSAATPATAASDKARAGQMRAEAAPAVENQGAKAPSTSAPAASAPAAGGWGAAFLQSNAAAATKAAEAAKKEIEQSAPAASSAAAPTFTFGFPPASSASAAADASTPSVAQAQDAGAAQPEEGTARKFNFGVAHSPAELAAAEVVRGVGDAPPPSKPVRHFRFGLPPGSPPSSPDSTRHSPAIEDAEEANKAAAAAAALPLPPDSEDEEDARQQDGQLTNGASKGLTSAAGGKFDAPAFSASTLANGGDLSFLARPAGTAFSAPAFGIAATTPVFGGTPASLSAEGSQPTGGTQWAPSTTSTSAALSAWPAAAFGATVAPMASSAAAEATTLGFGFGGTSAAASSSGSAAPFTFGSLAPAAPQVAADGDDAAAGTASEITASAAAAPASSRESQPLSLPSQTGLSFGVSSSGAAPSFLFGSKPPASAGTDGVSQPAGTSAPPISSNFQTSQASTGPFSFASTQAPPANGAPAAEAGPGAVGLSPSTSAGNESLASVEMMSPKSDAGLSSGPALPGFGAFGQPASGPSSTASGGAGTSAAFGASGAAFSAAPAFGAAGGALTFGSTDSRGGSAFAGGVAGGMGSQPASAPAFSLPFGGSSGLAFGESAAGFAASSAAGGASSAAFGGASALFGGGGGSAPSVFSQSAPAWAAASGPMQFGQSTPAFGNAAQAAPAAFGSSQPAFGTLQTAFSGAKPASALGGMPSGGLPPGGFAFQAGAAPAQVGFGNAQMAQPPGFNGAAAAPAGGFALGSGDPAARRKLKVRKSGRK